MKAWGDHVYRVGNEENLNVLNPDETIDKQKKDIEPWLAAVFQSEHLALLLGSGFTKAVAHQAGTTASGMECEYTGFPYGNKLKKAADEAAQAMGRGKANIEDQIRAANILAQGIKILGGKGHTEVTSALNMLFKQFLNGISKSERDLKLEIEKGASCTKNDKPSPEGDNDGTSTEGANDETPAEGARDETSAEGANDETPAEGARDETSAEGTSDEPTSDKLDPLVMLVSFLLSFSSRTATRERLHIFTTNYDRLIEYGADLAGLHLIDRFVGGLEPIFRSSRLDIDMHYNPPGIRGEPRYLEGVVRLTKLHGSLDWTYRQGFVRKVGLPFGPQDDHPAFNDQPSNSVMIYPNSAKDRETSEYPYVELFRDYAAAICRPNSVLVTYGYGFGDDHINRTIADMLTIPSTHLVIISLSDECGRISSFCQQVGRRAQISLLIGTHFGNMATLVENYLPKPAIDTITLRQTLLLRNRGWEPAYQNNEGEKA